MGDPYFGKVRKRWSEDTQGTTSATATRAAETGYKHVITGISGSSDAASIVTVESPSGTAIWRGRVAAGGAYTMSFAPGTLVGDSDALVRVVTGTGTSACEANISGFTVKG